jgi:hypothetical protein
VPTLLRTACQASSEPRTGRRYGRALRDGARQPVRTLSPSGVLAGCGPAAVSGLLRAQALGWRAGGGTPPYPPRRSRSEPGLSHSRQMTTHAAHPHRQPPTGRVSSKARASPPRTAQAAKARSNATVGFALSLLGSLVRSPQSPNQWWLWPQPVALSVGRSPTENERPPQTLMHQRPVLCARQGMGICRKFYGPNRVLREPCRWTRSARRRDSDLGTFDDVVASKLL